MKVSWVKPVTAQCENAAVTTLCRFQRGVTEVCAVLSAVALFVICRVLCAEVVGATSSEGFLYYAYDDNNITPKYLANSDIH